MKYIVTLNNKNYEVDVTQTEAAIKSVTPVQQVSTPVTDAPASPTKPAAVSEGMQVKSPMPGNILAVKAQVGQAVQAGDVLFLLEAMKMENEIVAPVSGTVKQILVDKGSVVETDAVLAVL